VIHEPGAGENAPGPHWKLKYHASTAGIAPAAECARDAHERVWIDQVDSANVETQRENLRRQPTDQFFRADRGVVPQPSRDVDRRAVAMGFEEHL
jgi:hypothetical protein